MQNQFKLPCISEITIPIDLNSIEDYSLKSICYQFKKAITYKEILDEFGLSYMYSYDSAQLLKDKIEKVVYNITKKLIIHTLFRWYAPLFYNSLLLPKTTYVQLFLTRFDDIENVIKINHPDDKKCAISFEVLQNIIRDLLETLYHFSSNLDLHYDTVCAIRFINGRNPLNRNDIFLYKNVLFKKYCIRVPTTGNPVYTIPAEAAYFSHIKIDVLQAKIKLNEKFDHKDACTIPLSDNCTFEVL